MTYLSKITKGFQFLFALFLLYFFFRLLIYHFYLTTFPYSNTYREGALMATTDIIQHGIKPYNYLSEPQYTNIYGIIYPLINLPFVRLFGMNVVVYRAVTAFFIFASCVVIFLVLKKKKVPLLLNIWALLALHASLLFPITSTPCADPASTGLFFMLLCIFIPFLLDYSYTSVFISIFFGVLAFYTKPYFVLGIPLMASYLFFFVSKSKSIFYGCLSLILFIFNVIIMNHFFPSYFDDCFFIHNNYAAATSMPTALKRQLDQFLDLNKGPFFLILMFFIYSLYRWFIVNKITDAPKIFKNLLTSIQWKGWATPLIINRLPLVIYAGIYFWLILVLFLGKHDGANWYFFQLFSPFLVAFIAGVAGRFTLWPIVFSCLLIYNLFSLTSDDDNRYFKQNLSSWHDIERIVKSNKSIFNTSLIAPLMIKENKEVYDDGQTEYFIGGGQRKGLMGRFFPEDKRVDLTETLFLNKIQAMLEYKKFDFIIVEAGYSSPVMPYNIANSYKMLASIWVLVPQDRKFFLMTIWSPI